MKQVDTLTPLKLATLDLSLYVECACQCGTVRTADDVLWINDEPYISPRHYDNEKAIRATYYIDNPRRAHR